MKRRKITSRTTTQLKSEEKKENSKLTTKETVANDDKQRNTNGNKKSWLIRTLTKIHNSYTPHTTKSKFHIENTPEAACNNTKILREFNLDIKAAVDHDGNSIIKPGTEFRDIKSIAELVNCHKDAARIRENITLGVSYPINLDEYDNETRMSDLRAGIQKGNNKSAAHPESVIALQKAYNKEVDKGWAS